MISLRKTWLKYACRVIGKNCQLLNTLQNKMHHFFKKWYVCNIPNQLKMHYQINREPCYIDSRKTMKNTLELGCSLKKAVKSKPIVRSVWYFVGMLSQHSSFEIKINPFKKSAFSIYIGQETFRVTLVYIILCCICVEDNEIHL